MQQTAKHALMRKNNTLSVLKCIWSFGPVTKHDIQDKTGLSWGAVSSITTELLKKGVISESRSAASTLGRTPLQYEINTSENLIVGIDLNIVGIRVVMMNLKCTVLDIVNEKVLINERDEIINQTKRMVHDLLKRTSVSIDKLIGIGIAAQGVVDPENGIAVFSPYFTDWTDVPLRSIFQDEFHVPVYVEHDPNCMALTEKWLSFGGNIENLLFIRLSMGVGASFIIDGNIYRGADGCAGEFGHITMNPNGGRCTCGNYGCLEVYASAHKILQQASEGMKLGRTTVLQSLVDDVGDIELDTVIKAARQGDSYIRSLFDELSIYLGIGVSNLINMFNPELIVIGGELSRCSDLFLDRMKDTVYQKVWKNSRVNISISKNNVDSAAIGAATLFVEKVFAGEKIIDL